MKFCIVSRMTISVKKVGAFGVEINKMPNDRYYWSKSPIEI